MPATYTAARQFAWPVTTKCEPLRRKYPEKMVYCPANHLRNSSKMKFSIKQIAAQAGVSMITPWNA